MKGDSHTPAFRILSGNQITRIHEKTLIVLEEIGVQVLHEEALDMLKGAGGKLQEDSTVRIPHQMVERALKTSPRTCEIFDREGNSRMILDGTRTYYGSFSDSFLILDHELGRARPFLLRDIRTVVKVIDAMPNIRFMTCPGILPREEPGMAPRLTFKECFKNTKKPFSFHGDRNTCTDIINFCLRVSGGRSAFQSKPFIFRAIEPISPLRHSQEGVEGILTCADYDIPLVYYPYCLMGGTSPVTIAGSLVQCNAEVLSGLVIQQLRNPGAPFVYGAMPAPMDMRTTTGLYGAPELHLAIAASCEIARYYGLPFFGTAGVSDSKHLDYQGVMEATMSCLMTGFSRPDLAHDVGLLDHSNIVSPELIVLTNEIIDMIQPLVQGIPVDEETLAIDVIRKVGPGTRNFIQEDHTYRHFRSFWYPGLLDRSMEGETPDLREKVKEKLREILRHHEAEPLPRDVAQGLERLVPG
ncbi:MAG: trimethylamine methyltransferase family protein [Deltaproteobacteria bacterium]|nr:trimethylamine methyltransferase family protein [Deltaproteobacteria bacterium]